MSSLDLSAGVERLSIDLDQQWEVDYWTRKFGVDVEELRRAVIATGPTVTSVAHLLAMSGSQGALADDPSPTIGKDRFKAR